MLDSSESYHTRQHRDDNVQGCDSPYLFPAHAQVYPTAQSLSSSAFPWQTASYGHLFWGGLSLGDWKQAQDSRAKNPRTPGTQHMVQKRSWLIFPIKSQFLSILGFPGLSISATDTQLCHYGTEIVMANTEVNGCGCVQTRPLFANRGDDQRSLFAGACSRRQEDMGSKAHIRSLRSCKLIEPWKEVCVEVTKVGLLELFRTGATSHTWQQST